MSNYAKSVVSAVAAVLIAGIQAWQTIVGGRPFRPVDVLPIAVAAVGAFYVYLVPEVPELERAKGKIAYGFAVLTALSTFAVGHPADVTVLNLAVAGLGAALTAYVPNLPSGVAPALAAAGHVDPVEITDALRQLEQLPAVPQVAAPTSPPPIPTPVTVPADLPPALSGPLPIEAEALAAAQTAPLPALNPETGVPA